MLRFALFSPPDEGPPLFKDHLCVNHRVVFQEGDYCIRISYIIIKIRIEVLGIFSYNSANLLNIHGQSVLDNWTTIFLV